MKSQFVVLKALALAATLTQLGACVVGPKYVRPGVATPSAYKETGDWKVAQPRDDAKRGKWWEIFGDAQLSALAEQIDISNQNVRIAEAQYRQAQALVQQARASLFPTLTGTVTDTRSRSPNVGSQAVTTTAPVNTYNQIGRASCRERV